MHHYESSPRAERKNDGTWVTEADWAVEAQIRLHIARSWPGYNVLGEEEGLTAAGGGAPQPGAPTWVIDPIDGTHSFMSEIPVWATLVALRIDDVNVLGVAHAPALGETYDAALGAGARMNGKPIHVDPIEELGAAQVASAGAEAFARAGLGSFYLELVGRAWRSRGFGDFWGHMLVARGAAHVMVETELHLWDVAALEPIVTEAGGKVTQLDGSPLRARGSCLTTCGTLHDEVAGLVRSHRPPQAGA